MKELLVWYMWTGFAVFVSPSFSFGFPYLLPLLPAWVSSTWSDSAVETFLFMVASCSRHSYVVAVRHMRRRCATAPLHALNLLPLSATPSFFHYCAQVGSIFFPLIWNLLVFLPVLFDISLIVLFGYAATALLRCLIPFLTLSFLLLPTLLFSLFSFYHISSVVLQRFPNAFVSMMCLTQPCIRFRA